MNALQKKEFDMLRRLIDVCDQLDLKYYLVCGSALGAVKYHGFIPWDDDVDIALPRKDYEILFEKGPTLLSKEYFLQNAQTDKYFPLISGKLRDPNTTFIEKNLSDIDIVHGAYIDIFPLDGYPDNTVRRRVFNEIKKTFERRRTVSLSRERLSQNEKRGIRTCIVYFLHDRFGMYANTSKTIRKYNSFVSSFDMNSCKIACNHHEEIALNNYCPSEWYGAGTLCKFEGFSFRIPAEYDKYLTKRYSDWRADLPEDQKVGHHYAEVIDLTRPYTDYIVKLKNGKIRLKTSEELLNSGITPPEGYKFG